MTEKEVGDVNANSSAQIFLQTRRVCVPYCDSLGPWARMNTALQCGVLDRDIT